MNDFTKDELQAINDILTESDEANKELVLKLSSKLQCMIDNYPDSCSESIRKYHELED